MIHRRISGPFVALMLIALGAGLGACSSGTPPTTEIGAARVAIDSAERAGATDYAPVELNNARIKLNHAQDAANQSEYEMALWLAEEAQVDAEVAGAKAQATAAQRALQEVQGGTGSQRPITPR